MCWHLVARTTPLCQQLTKVLVHYHIQQEGLGCILPVTQQNTVCSNRQIFCELRQCRIGGSLPVLRSISLGCSNSLPPPALASHLVCEALQPQMPGLVASAHLPPKREVQTEPPPPTHTHTHNEKQTKPNNTELYQKLALT